MLDMQGPNDDFGPDVEVKSQVEWKVLLEAETLLVASCGFLKLTKLN